MPVVSGPDELFHYTTNEFAEECLRDFDDPGIYAEISVGQYGRGFYALDLGPEHPRERLRWECFGDWRANHPMDGLLVIDPGLAVPPFEYQEHHIWMMRLDNRVAIDHMVTAIGFWDRGSWTLHET